MSVYSDDGQRTLEEMEREALIEAIRSQGSIAGAARRLGIGRATAFRKVRKFGLRDEELAYSPVVEPPTPKPEPGPLPEPPAKSEKKAEPMADPLFANWKP